MGGKWRPPYENAEGVMVKECSQCGMHRPVDMFNLYDPKRSSTKLRADCIDCQAGRQRAWRERNPEAVAKRSREQSRSESGDPRKRLDGKIRAGISGFLSGRHAGTWAFQNLEFTRDELRTHLESSFVGKMSWDNYAKFGWHVDHRVPLAAFDYQTADDPQFKQAWALSNLQPLWWHENAWKGARVAANDNEGVELNHSGRRRAA